MFKIIHVCIAVAAVAVLSACGGGGGGGGGSTFGSGSSSSSSSSSVSGWISGVFSAASTFKDKCATVRTGVDLAGNAFTDKAGTALDEKMWLRSWTHETYLWNDEVVDTDPALYTSATSYFSVLKTNAVTASGKAKDQFHFSEPTTDYLTRQLSSGTASYGAEFAVLQGSIPRDVRVMYTEPGSPAEALSGGVPKLVRGTKILTVNGVDIVNGATTQAQVNALNAALFPAAAGTTTTMTVQDPGSSTTRSISLTSANVATKPVNRTRVLTDGTGKKYGYVLFNTFSPYSSESDIVTAMTSMKTQGVNDLVLDLRYNGGGLLAVASELSYMVAGTATSGKTFDKLRFNALAGTHDPVTGAVNNPIPFYSTGLGFSVTSGTALPALNLGRVFVLTTDDTCSASETVINGLRGVGVNVVQIGGKTCGKPYGFYPQDNCGTTYYAIQFQGTNDLGFGDYADGFTPTNSSDTTGVKIAGCAVSDDYSHNLGDGNEALLKTAMAYGLSGTCPAISSVSARSSAASARSTASSPALVKPQRGVMDTNMDVRLHR